MGRKQKIIPPIRATMEEVVDATFAKKKTDTQKRNLPQNDLQPTDKTIPNINYKPTKDKT